MLLLVFCVSSLGSIEWYVMCQFWVLLIPFQTHIISRPVCRCSKPQTEVKSFLKPKTYWVWPAIPQIHTADQLTVRWRRSTENLQLYNIRKTIEVRKSALSSSARWLQNKKGWTKAPKGNEPAISACALQFEELCKLFKIAWWFTAFLYVLSIYANTKSAMHACTRTSKAFKVQLQDIIIRHFVTSSFKTVHLQIFLQKLLWRSWWVHFYKTYTDEKQIKNSNIQLNIKIITLLVLKENRFKVDVNFQILRDPLTLTLTSPQKMKF